MSLFNLQCANRLSQAAFQPVPLSPSHNTWYDSPNVSRLTRAKYLTSEQHTLAAAWLGPNRFNSLISQRFSEENLHVRPP
jgi:hypothetical protein